MSVQNVLVAGAWRESRSGKSFAAENPRTCQAFDETYPVSDWADCDEALDAAVAAAAELRRLPRASLARFLEAFADRIEARSGEICAMAHAETALPLSPRLADVELPRTTAQLRAAAVAARDGSWATATIDTAAGIRSCFVPIGPVCVFGPNNFPLAFNSASGGDFAAAIAAGNPVIAKANSSHPATTRLLAEAAHGAVVDSKMPAATVQLIYRTSHEDGERLVADPRMGATGYTGSRSAGLKLKAAADRAGKPIYLELSSINPVVFLAGALDERFDAVVDEYAGSCLMGTGQFCTNPGLALFVDADAGHRFVAAVAERFRQAPIGTLLSSGVQSQLQTNLETLIRAGAEVVAQGGSGGDGYHHANTLLSVDAARFLQCPEVFQTEVFGNVALAVIAGSVDEAAQVLRALEGNLTGCIYSHTGGADDVVYDRLAPLLAERVGRLLNDKMPTGVAVSAAMNHGGPFPATGHPGFTAVGIPAALRRFARLLCYDNVRTSRLPDLLANRNPTGNTWRLIDGQWSQSDVG
ncbi:MAG: aldehyde dehydrogenase (NADP(+)) [Pirellulales bacterium]|nr:aldehyde dehydrogenase (NADP(+)) [Planctomycetales bacterium]